MGDAPPYKIISYTFSVKDTNPIGATQISTSQVKIVLPYFYGALQVLATQSSGANNINGYLGTNSTAPTNKLKRILVEPIIGSPTLSNNQSLNITTQGLGATPDGQGYLYFGYPSYYPLLKDIISPYNNITVLPAFTTYSINITTDRMTSRPYIFYISNQTTAPVSALPFQFIFATQS